MGLSKRGARLRDWREGQNHRECRTGFAGSEFCSDMKLEAIAALITDDSDLIRD
jgi:hypothetical protein